MFLKETPIENVCFVLFRCFWSTQAFIVFIISILLFHTVNFFQGTLKCYGSRLPLYLVPLYILNLILELPCAVNYNCFSQWSKNGQFCTAYAENVSAVAASYCDQRQSFAFLCASAFNF